MLLSHVFDLFQSVYQWIVKPQTIIKSNEMFLPGRMTFVYDMVMLFYLFSWADSILLHVLICFFIFGSTHTCVFCLRKFSLSISSIVF